MSTRGRGDSRVLGNPRKCAGRGGRTHATTLAEAAAPTRRRWPRRPHPRDDEGRGEKLETRHSMSTRVLQSHTRLARRLRWHSPRARAAAPAFVVAWVRPLRPSSSRGCGRLGLCRVGAAVLFHEPPRPGPLCGGHVPAAVPEGLPDAGVTYHGSDEVLNQNYDHRNKIILATDADFDHTGALPCVSGVVALLNGGARRRARPTRPRRR